MTFTMPEALTEWKFLGFAHDKQLRAGFLTDKVVTAKDLMVEPNPPRFVREGDAIEFTVKVSNQTEQTQSGKVRLTFADAATLKPWTTHSATAPPNKLSTCRPNNRAVIPGVSPCRTEWVFSPTRPSAQPRRPAMARKVSCRS